MPDELSEDDRRIVTILNNFGFIPIECGIIVAVRDHGTISTRDLAVELDTNRERIRKYASKLQNSNVLDSAMYRNGFIYKLPLDFFDNLYSIAEERYQNDIRRINVLEKLL